jgi:hypothetical protein
VPLILKNAINNNKTIAKRKSAITFRTERQACLRESNKEDGGEESERVIGTQGVQQIKGVYLTVTSSNKTSSLPSDFSGFLRSRNVILGSQRLRSHRRRGEILSQFYLTLDK